MPKPPPFQGPTPDDLASPATVQAYVASVTILMPESEIRATRVFASDGRFLRYVTPDRISDAVAMMVEHPNYHSIRAPALAIFAVQEQTEQLLPRYRFADAVTQDVMRKMFAIWKEFAARQRESFRREMPRARVVELRGASHAVYISNSKLVLAELRSFLLPQ